MANFSKTFKISSLILLAVFILQSCEEKKDYVLKVQLHQLSKADIYDKKLVYDVIFDAEENNLDSLKYESRELFLKGADYAKNKDNPYQAAGFFKESILVFPDAKTYYELGNALIDENGKYNLEEALKAFEVAEYLQFQPISNVYYKQACVDNLLSELVDKEERAHYRTMAFSDLKKAFEAGFFDTLSLMKDNRINSLTSSVEYKKMLFELVADGQNAGTGQNAFFDLYRNSFPSLNSHLDIGLSNIDLNEYDESISYDFAKFIPEMENIEFGRDVSHDFFYVAKVSETPQYTALVYSSVNFYGSEMAPIHTTLATYTNDGELISKKLISCRCTPEKIKTVVIDNNVIEIKDYKRTWEHPIDKVSFSENKVKSSELIAEAKYKIDDTGKIIDDVVPQNYSDSSIVASR